ncbi:hypothetical protein BMW26_05820 [Microbacterium sp. 1.5R]|uniref:UPF0182 family membrane protein n=1 Tax=Microbacterium TaxID=33882 RepID=UPI00069FE64C|nr:MULTISPECIES: UPF0182 family protein [unclassified Microbacterium]AKV85147.1 hypothetical protein AKG07_01260 [Microbacterium sp. CGR1]APH44533.1 hypothetical protein BMW26_05820 [Microbacterium sp. 1.5R]KRD51700.1 hypothetical protein ASE34_07065 [Microbacterium sp. Root280D1]MBC6494180.1 hypothetical protein [Microbacterium sp. 4-7]MDY0982298.1 UPF0182 family protein [Microbacterium sp. CFBP9023]
MTSTSAPNPATPRTSRRIFGISLAIIAALIAAFFVFASLYTEFLWFDQVGFAGVLTTQWFATAVMFVVGFLGMAVPLFVAIQLAYRLRPVYVRLSSQLDRYQEVIEPLRRLAMWGMPIFFGLFAGFSAASQWKTVWLWANGVATDATDPQFGVDTGFYMFAMPFYSILLAFVSAVLLLTLIVTALVSYLYGSVRIGQGELRISKPARIQLAVIAGLYLLVQAASLWLDRYKTLVAQDDRIVGPAYTGVNATIPGLAILAIIAALVAILFFVTAVIGRWRFPLAATALLIVASLVVGVGFPWAVTTFQVRPNQNAYQAEFYQRNIDGTKEAYGVADLETTPFEAETDAEAGQLREDAETTASIRIVDPNVISPAVRQLEQYRGYYQFQEKLDVDRYEIGGEMQDTVVSVRDLDMNGVDVTNWNNRAAVYTHGYGLVVAAGNQRTPDGEPVFLERGIPSDGFLTQQEEFEPRVYFGENSPEYSIVGSPDGTDPVEIDYPRGKDGASETKTTFEGDGGPKIGSSFTKLLYALKFQSEQILFSNLVNDDSQILYDRDPKTRVQKVAPYLELDSDPYPSVVDGRIVWIVDGYTTSSTYPYSTNVSLSDAIADSNLPSPTLAIDEINYIRNSVKATVDAYDGSVTLYAWDDQDPVLQTWQNIYPSTLKPVSDMSADLMSHVRYPTDLFKVQRDILGTYHIDTAGSFAQQDNRWQTPNDPRSEQVLQPPYYLTMQMPGQDSPRFSMFSTFIPSAQGGSNRDVLMGYLAVDSDAGSEAGVKAEGYGQLRMLEIDTDTTVPGPGQVQNTYNSDTAVVPQLNLLQQGESEVLYGNLLTLPVGGGLLYVQPVYVQSSEGTKLPRLQKVLVAFGDKVAFEDTLTAALDTLFGGDAGATGGDDEVEPTEPDPDTGEVPTEPTVPTDAEAEALAAAQQALTDREAALKAGDLTKFAEADKRLTDAVNTLLGLEAASGE